MNRHNTMNGIIQRGADQVRHGRVNNGKAFFWGFLDIQNLSDQNAGGAHDKTAGLKDHLARPIPQRGFDHGAIIGQGERGPLMIRNADSAPQIQMIDDNAVTRQIPHHLHNKAIRSLIRGQRQNLRPNMHRESLPMQVRRGLHAVNGRRQSGQGHTEFVILFPRGDFGVGFGIHVGIDAQGNTGGMAKGRCQRLNHIQLRQRFHVDLGNAMMQGQIDFLRRFPHARKNNFLGGNASIDGLPQLVPRHHIGT